MSMAFVAVDKNGCECVFSIKPERSPYCTWCIRMYGSYIELSKGSIKKLIGRELTWNDEPVELK